MSAVQPVRARGGLAARLVGVSLLTLLVIQLCVFVIVRSTITDQARRQLAAELTVGERGWLRLLDQHAEKLRQGATLLAADYGFRSAVSSGDVATIESALDNHGERIGAHVAALLGPDLGLRAMTLSAAAGAQAGGAPLVTGEGLQRIALLLAQQPQRRGLALEGRLPYQYVMVPVRAPTVVGWVLMGFPIDQAQVEDMRRLFSMHLAVLALPQQGVASVAVSTLPGLDSAVLQAPAGRLRELALHDEIFEARQVALPAVLGEVQTVLLRSYSEAMAPYHRLQWVLGLITVAGLLLFAVVSWSAMRRVTRPLRRLQRAAQALEQGHFDVPIEDTGRGDEVGRLARGFDTMRSSLAAQQAEIRRLAYWDRLTGLPNREQFREVLRQAIAAGSETGEPVAVLMLNLDRFKHVNEVLGYALGDALLQAVAERLRQQVVRQGDLVARLGGDEFAVLLSRTDAQGAVTMGQRIAGAFETPLALEQQTVDLSASMGVACWPGDAPDPDTLMSRAEIAMRTAKARTTGLCIYEPSLDSSSSQTLSLLTDLRQALEHDQLRLFVQPKVDVASGAVVALEALVRWEHPQRGLVPPLQFIPFAEQTGFVRQLTLWMFQETCRQWAGLQVTGATLRMAINLSTRDLMDQEFAPRVADLLRQHGVPTAGICLEITESAIMDDPQRAEATLNKLAALGFKLSIDDFGTGYSSLAYLKRLPVDELKIDKSFVMGMESDDSDAKIVRSTIDLAHNLGLTVVAEGVENAAILQGLRDLNCDEAQGYFISRPMPVQDFVRWHDAWSQRTV